jgi:Immunoglobulin I-set domain
MIITGLCEFIHQQISIGAFQVQWLFNDRPVNLIDYELTSEGNKHYLHIPEVFAEDAGTFTAVATNEVGRAIHSAKLTVVDDLKPMVRPPAGGNETETHTSFMSAPLVANRPPPSDEHMTLSVMSTSAEMSLLATQMSSGEFAEQQRPVKQRDAEGLRIAGENDPTGVSE